MEQTPELFRFGRFEFAPRSGDLVSGGRRIPLQPQPARLLALLLSRAGELVTREEIQRALWPDTRVEFDQGLNFCVRQIRAALGERAGAAVYLETVPRRGYRFIAPVQRVGKDDPPAPPSEPDELPAPPRHRRVRWGLVAALALALAAGAMWTVFGHRAPPRIAILPIDVDSTDAGALAAGNLLVEGIVAELSRGGPARLAVLGPSSTRGMGGSRSPVQPIRRALGADYVLSGRLAVRGDTVYAFTQLIRTRDGVHLWAELYRHAPARFGEVPREVSAQVERRLLQPREKDL